MLPHAKHNFEVLLIYTLTPLPTYEIGTTEIPITDEKTGTQILVVTYSWLHSEIRVQFGQFGSKICSFNYYIRLMAVIYFYSHMITTMISCSQIENTALYLKTNYHRLFLICPILTLKITFKLHYPEVQ